MNHAFKKHLARSTAAITSLLISLVAIAMFASAAQAKQARIFTGSFGGSATSTPAPYPVTQPWSVAVDNSTSSSSGDIYVSDGEHHRVEKFGPAGNFLLMFGKEVNKGKVEGGGATEVEEDLCLAGEECQSGTAGTTPGAFGGGPNGEVGILYVAVDDASGDVYVGDYSDGTVSKFDPSGNLIASWAAGGQLAGSGVETFGQIIGLAVDPTGRLWVEAGPPASNPRAFEFKQDATFTGNSWPIRVTTGGGGAQVEIRGFAVDAEEHVYLDAATSIWKFSNGGEKIGLVTGLGVRAEGLTVDHETGDVYVDAILEGGESAINRYDTSCKPVPDFAFHGCVPAETYSPPGFSAGVPQALAIYSGEASKPLYVSKFFGDEVATYAIRTVPDVVTMKASGFTPSAATLNGTVNPSGEALTECYFEWGETESYGEVAECEPDATALGEGNSPVPVHAQIPVQPGHNYHFRLLAANANDDAASPADEPVLGEDLAFGPPLIDSTSAVGVSATGATLTAEINPQNVATRYRFEYLSEGAYIANGESFAGAEPAISIPASDATIGAGGADVTVSQDLQGLQPATTYVYRAVAQSALGEGAEATIGPIRRFFTQTPGPFVLPDSRAWEMVSPPDKHGALIEPIGASFVEYAAIQAAADGSAITYVTDAPIQSQPRGYIVAAQILSTRDAGGWSSSEVSLPQSSATGLPHGRSDFRAFSPDLGLGAVQPIGAFQPSLSPEASEQTAYLHVDFAPGQPNQPCASSCFLPLVSAANVPPGTEFGEEGSCPPQVNCGPQFEGASPDLSHIVLASEVGLTSVPGDKGGLYEWSAGSLGLVSQAPAGGATNCGGSGSACVPAKAPGLGAGSGTGIYPFPSKRSAVSGDGSRVFWTDTTSGHLYVRDSATEETVQLDVPQVGASGAGKVIPRFQTASADGSRAFFTDQQALTADSGAEADVADLYECQIETTPNGLACALTDLTPESGGEGADVLGILPGTSADGTYVYFVANGALAPGATPGDCIPAGAFSPAQLSCNLYLRHGGTTIFIARLSDADGPSWGTNTSGSVATLTSRVSPSGEWFAFMSQRPLTGYDNRDAVSGQRDEEVYLYHAAREGRSATLTCASCAPTGSRPHGVPAVRNGVEATLPLAAPNGAWHEEDWLAANLPRWTTSMGNGDGIYQPRYLSDSGRLFFNSSDSLVPKDVNGKGDVYQYEPEGTGSCSTATASGSEVFVPATTVEVEGREVTQAAGCVALISSGDTPNEAAFLDASESGDDVFFLTAAPISGRDSDQALDLYDARVGGGFAEPTAPIPCSGDACQQPAVPPARPTPGTTTLNGPGNVKQCQKGKRIQKGKCVKQKSKKKKKHKKKSTKGSKKHKRAGSEHGGQK